VLGFGGGGPCEGFRILVSNPFVDCGFEFSDIVENASPYALSVDFGEEPLDEIEPGPGHRREVQDEACLANQPFTAGVLWVAQLSRIRCRSRGAGFRDRSS
jgi:hypothetical protein